MYPQILIIYAFGGVFTWLGILQKSNAPSESQKQEQSSAWMQFLVCLLWPVTLLVTIRTCLSDRHCKK